MTLNTPQVQAARRIALARARARVSGRVGAAPFANPADGYAQLSGYADDVNPLTSCTHGFVGSRRRPPRDTGYATLGGGALPFFQGAARNTGYVTLGAAPFANPADGYAQLSGMPPGDCFPNTFRGSAAGYGVGEMWGQATARDMWRNAEYQATLIQYGVPVVTAVFALPVIAVALGVSAPALAVAAAGGGIATLTVWAVKKLANGEEEFVPIRSPDPIRMLNNILISYGCYVDDDPFAGTGDAICCLQEQLGVERTGVVDGPTMEALEVREPLFRDEVYNALAVLGADPEHNGIEGAIMSVQQRFGYPSTGVIDSGAARAFDQIYKPSEDELEQWAEMAREKTPLDYVKDPDGLRRDAAALKENVDKNTSTSLEWIKRFIRRVGTDWRTYAGLAGSVVLSAVVPAVPALRALAIVPTAGALLYELTDEITKEES